MATLSLIVLALPAAGCGGGRAYAPLAEDVMELRFVPALASPAPQSVSVAETAVAADSMTLAVNVTQPGEPVFGAAFDAVFDPTVIEFIGWDPGSALEADGGTATYLVQSDPGRVEVGASLQGGQGAGVPGTRPLILLTFRLLEEGNSALGFENASLLDDGPPLPQPISGLSWFGGTFSVE